MPLQEQEKWKQGLQNLMKKLEKQQDYIQCQMFLEKNLSSQEIENIKIHSIKKDILYLKVKLPEVMYLLNSKKAKLLEGMKDLNIKDIKFKLGE